MNMLALTMDISAHCQYNSIHRYVMSFSTLPGSETIMYLFKAINIYFNSHRGNTIYIHIMRRLYGQSQSGVLENWNSEFFPS